MGRFWKILHNYLWNRKKYLAMNYLILPGFALYISRVSHVHQVFWTPVHKNYKANEFQFCMVITLDHHHPVYQVL